MSLETKMAQPKGSNAVKTSTNNVCRLFNLARNAMYLLECPQEKKNPQM